MSPLVIAKASAVSPLGADLDAIWSRLIARDVVHGVAETPGGRRFHVAECIPGAASDIDAYAPLFATTLRKLMHDLDLRAPVDAIYFATAVGNLAEVEADVYRGRAPALARLDFAERRSLFDGLAGVGPNTRFICVATGCCAGLQALGLAKATMPKLGFTRAVVVGLDFALTPLALQAFARINATAAFDPERTDSPSRPFCARRDGFLIADGGAALLVAIGANEPAALRVTGYGCVSSAFHMTDIPLDGGPIRTSMEKALRQAGRSAAEVGHVNLHASGTQQNDLAEYRALMDLFDARPPPITAFKGHHGHALGGANLIEIALCWKMLRENLAPPTAARLAMDAFAQFPPRPTSTALNGGALLKTASGFSGIHAAVVMERGDDSDIRH